MNGSWNFTTDGLGEERARARASENEDSSGFACIQGAPWSDSGSDSDADTGSDSGSESSASGSISRVSICICDFSIPETIFSAAVVWRLEVGGWIDFVLGDCGDGDEDDDDGVVVVVEGEVEPLDGEQLLLLLLEVDEKVKEVLNVKVDGGGVGRNGELSISGDGSASSSAAS